MFDLKNEYETACGTVSDINEHIPTLYQLALDCQSATEFGVRTGNSTRAFLYAGVKLRSYDLFLDPALTSLFNFCKSINMNVDYIQGNDLELTIEPVDLLFIDSLHTYKQVKEELQIHAKMVNKYIAFHDTQIFGTIGEDNNLGLLPAIMEFLRDNPCWRVKQHSTNNNGLTILQRYFI